MVCILLRRDPLQIVYSVVGLVVVNVIYMRFAERIVKKRISNKPVNALVRANSILEQLDSQIALIIQ